MTAYLWTNLADGQSIAFNPDVDLLDLSNAASAAEVRFRAAGPGATSFTVGDKTITLNGLTLQQIVMWNPFDEFENVRFADGRLVVNGDTGATVFVQGNSDDQLLGFGGNDHLTGGGGDDVLDGGAGDDTLDGIGLPDSDTATYASAQSGVTVSLATSAAQDTGGAGTDTLLDIENLIGTAFDDALTGSAEDNVIEGGAGDDTMDGGDGIDTADYRYAAAGITLSLASALAQDTGGDGTDTLSGFENLRGSRHDDVLTGNASDNVVTGGAGNDDLDGGDGVDTAIYAGAASGVAADLVAGSASGGAGSDTLVGFENLTGSSYDDTLGGDAGNNVLLGGSGDDVLEGRSGDDSLDGGSGFDRVTYAAAAASVTVDLGDAAAQDIGGDAGTDTLVSIEEVVGSAFNDSLTGNAADNILDGGQGDDVLDGGEGRDLVTYLRPTTTSGVTVSLAAAGPQATGGAGVDTLLDIERLAGSIFGDTLTGSSIANDLYGDAGNDTIAGGSGNDLVDGGASNDTLDGGSSNDIVSGGSGNDALDGGTGNDTLDGGSGSDAIDGGSGNDTLDGGAGNDILDGGDGLDRVSYAAFAVSVNVSLATTARQNTGGAGNDTLIHIENLTGGSGKDTLTGNSAANLLDGGGGADTLIGGGGNDTYLVNSSSDKVTESAGGGTDLVQSTATTYSLSVNVEKLTLLGSGDIRGTGNTLNNTLTGNSGDNTLAGGAGNDTIVGGAGEDTLDGGAGDDVLDGGAGTDSMTGGTGNDTFKVDDRTDIVIESYGEGTDLVQSTADNYRLPLAAYVENLMLLGAARNGTGNLEDNVITGNSGANFLNGDWGDDTLIGGGGDDTLDGGGFGIDKLIGGPGDDSYYLSAPSDVLVEAAGEGSDTVYSYTSFTLATNFENLVLTGTSSKGTGNAHDNVLTGGYASDTLNGLAGDDVIRGGQGLDVLTGGSGADRFEFDHPTETPPDISQSDRITDFDRTEGDRIDLKTIDANPLTESDDAFQFIAGNPFSNTDATGQLRFDAATHLLMGSTDADAAAEFAILLTGVSSMTGASFIL